MKQSTEQPRANFYSLIHKAIRYKLYECAMELGTVDMSHEGDVAKIHECFNVVKKLLEHHAYHEDTYLHPFMVKYLPDEVALLEEEHVLHDKNLRHLDELAACLVQETNLAVQYTLGREFYLAYNKFAADFIQHLHFEECIVMPKLWPLCTDEELMQIHFKLTGSMSQDELHFYGKLFMPALNPQERTLLGGT